MDFMDLLDYMTYGNDSNYPTDEQFVIQSNNDNLGE